MGNLRFALRGLFKNRGFSAVAILSLALGIAASTALFSVIYGIVIKPYPYKEPEKIWSPHLTTEKDEDRWMAYPPSEYKQFAALPAFSEAMSTSPEGDMLLTGEYAPEMIRGVRVTGNAFQFLGVPTVIGRTILPVDVDSSGEPADVIVISYKMWRRLFDASPTAIGKSLRLNDHLYQIIGVMPPRFGWWTDNGFWMPLGMNETSIPRRAIPIVRLKPGVSAAVAQAQMQTLHEALAKEGSTNLPKEKFRTRIVNYLDMTVASGDMEKNLWLLFGAVILLLLIACANVANLQLARGSTRAREMAIRASIGADRWSLIRQLLTESVLLSVIGGAVGLLFAFWLTHGITRLLPDFMVPNESRIEMNGWVALFCAGISILTGIIFGLFPALEISKVDLTESIKDSANASGGSRRGAWTRKSLVVIEVALSVVLLLAAGLMMRTFIALQTVELGFRPQHAFTVNIQTTSTRYTTLQQRNQFALEFLDHIKRIPGVDAASIGNGGTAFNFFDSDIAIEGRSDGENTRSGVILISADYLKAMSIPLIAGREFTDREVTDGAEFAIVNQAALKFFAPGENPIGKRLYIDFLKNPGRAPKPDNATGYVTVVGVMGDTRNNLREIAKPLIAVPLTLVAPNGRAILIRSSTEPAVVASAMREQLKQMDREQPLGAPFTLPQIIAQETVQPRFAMALFGAFAVLGLILAAFGIYSVLSYFVSQRTRELGVRMALGARSIDILSLVLTTGGKLLCIGLAVGIAGGIAATRLLAELLYGVKPNDPLTFLIVALILSAIGLASCFLPARRASRLSPTEALRYE